MDSVKIRFFHCHPVVLLSAVWIVALFGAYFAPIEFFRDDPEYIFTRAGLIWIIASLGAFFLGSHFARGKRIVIRPYSPVPSIHTKMGENDGLSWNLIKKQIIVAEIITATIILILATFFVRTALHFGGVFELIHTLPERWHTVRRVFPDQKPFPGARLIYTGLVSVSIFSFSCLALIKNSPEKVPRLKFRAMLLVGVSTGLLLVLPIFVSQRLLIASGLVGGIIAYVSISNEPVSGKIPIVGVVLGLGVWTAQETIRAGFAPGGIGDSIVYSFRRLSYYFGNNVRNVMHGVEYTQSRAHGLLSLDFIFEFTFTGNKIRDPLLAEFSAEANQYRAAGTWTGMGVPYMDFGWAGLLLIFIFGFVSYQLYVLAQENFVMGQVYGLVGAAIVLSFHTAMWDSPNFWFQLSLIFIIAWLGIILQSNRYYSTLWDESA